MALAEPKYVASEDDTDAWSVTDAETAMPAVLDGVPQVGMSCDAAQGVAETLSAVTNDEDG